MALQQGSVTVGIAATINNLLAGEVFERAPYPSKIEIAVVADSANFVVEVSTGADMLMPEGPPSIANRVPIYPDDFTLVDAVDTGELIKIRVRNTDGAAAHVINYAVRLTPLGV